MNRFVTTRAAGFSLIEALVATALVLIITLGIMPLFTNSVIQNLSGKESTVSTNYSRSSSEELVPLPLDREVLRPPVSLAYQQICQDYEQGRGWEFVTCGAPPTGTPTWTRETFVQQYNIREIYDGDTAAGVPTFKNPVPGYPLSASRLDSSVHIRELMVITEGQRTPDSPLGPGRRVDLVNLRGF
ncbi:MAG: prepilin-type N-terminal cleavage/methylation domain-containing protein [Acidobacteria bacterium]|nr:prepilin-type N-terminal cleavage/methylation domain-containing protein [Acidobacteriota bacterium]